MPIEPMSHPDYESAETNTAGNVLLGLGYAIVFTIVLSIIANLF